MRTLYALLPGAAQALAGPAAAACLDLEGPEALPPVDHRRLTESSGVVVSLRDPGLLWTHDDSGTGPEIYAFRPGASRAVPTRVPGLRPVDWEDIAAGPCPDGSGPCLLVADIGDNRRRRPWVEVLALPEPERPGRRTGVVARWRFTWPGGPRNAEALLRDPRDGRLLVVSKEPDGAARVVRLPAEPTGPEPVEAEPVATLVVGGPTAADRMVTGGDWSAATGLLVLRTPTRLLLWDPGEGDPWSTPPLVLPAADEPQGEAVAVAPDGALYTTSEGRPMPVHRWRCAADPAYGPNSSR